jgi:hypothetical protein
LSFQSQGEMKKKGPKDLPENTCVLLLFWGRPLILLLGLLLLFQCSLKTPSAPTWNTKLTIPLLNKNYDMVTLIEKMDEPSLRTDSLRNLFFHISQDLDTIRLWGKLACGSVTEAFKETLGTIRITPAESRQMVFSVTDFYSGEPGWVPPGSAVIQADIDTFTSFYQATIQEGYLTLIVVNHLGLDLDSLQLDLIDKCSSQILKTLVIPGGIQEEDSIVHGPTLTDKTISNHLAVQVSVHTPGGFLSSLEDKYLSLDLSIDSLVVIEGIAQVPGFDLTAEEEILLPSDHTIDSAKIKAGNLSLDLFNHTGVLAEMMIDFPELKKDDQILKADRILPAGGHSNMQLSLEGYSFEPLSGSSLVAGMKIQATDSGDQLVFFSSSDSVTAAVSLSEVTFSQIAGVIEPTLVDMGEIHRDVDLPPGFENAHVKNARLSLDIHNGVNFPANVSVTVQGERGQTLQLSGEIEAGSPWATAVTSIQEHELDPLLDPIPQQLTVTGEVICGDGLFSGVVNEEDFFFGEIEVTSPLEMILDSCEVQIDEDSHTVNDDVKSLIEDQVNSGQVIFRIESHLPLDANVLILVSKDPGKVFSDPDLVLGPVTVLSGELDPNGLVTDSRTSESTINLNHDQLQIFRNSPFYVAGRLKFFGTDGKIIKALATDFIQITSYLEIEVKNKKDQ